MHPVLFHAEHIHSGRVIFDVSDRLFYLIAVMVVMRGVAWVVGAWRKG